MSAVSGAPAERGRLIDIGGALPRLGARGGGLASFSEDATDRDRMTLIGRITR